MRTHKVCDDTLVIKDINGDSPMDAEEVKDAFDWLSAIENKSIYVVSDKEIEQLTCEYSLEDEWNILQKDRGDSKSIFFDGIVISQVGGKMAMQYLTVVFPKSIRVLVFMWYGNVPAVTIRLEIIKDKKGKHCFNISSSIDKVRDEDTFEEVCKQVIKATFAEHKAAHSMLAWCTASADNRTRLTKLMPKSNNTCTGLKGMYYNASPYLIGVASVLPAGALDQTYSTPSICMSDTKTFASDLGVEDSAYRLFVPLDVNSKIGQAFAKEHPPIKFLGVTKVPYFEEGSLKMVKVYFVECFNRMKFFWSDEEKVLRAIVNM